MPIQTSQADIVVTSPDGEYLLLVEVTLGSSEFASQAAIEQLKYLMVSYGCSSGLVVAGERLIVLRDSLEESNGESINVLGEAKLPDNLVPATNRALRTGLEYKKQQFVLQVQQWLEALKLDSTVGNLPNDLKRLLGEPILSLLQLGEVRAGGPRWSRVPT